MKKFFYLVLAATMCAVAGVRADYNPSWTGDQYTIRNVNSSGSVEGNIAGNLFDNDWNSKWVDGRFFDGNNMSEEELKQQAYNPELWVSFETSQFVRITSYTLTTGDDTEYYPRNPKTWRLEASADNSNWAILDSHTNDNILPNENHVSREFAIPANKQALNRYYRLVIQTTNDNRNFGESEEDGHPILSVLVQLSGLSLATETCNHRDDNHDGICDICHGEIPEDPANYFCEGDFWYEKCTIDGVNGVKILSIANSVTTLNIPQTVYHRRNYPVLAISDGIGGQKNYNTGEIIWEGGQEQEKVIFLNGQQHSEHISQITFAPNSMVKIIDDDAFAEIGSESISLGTITIPASVRSIGNGALNPAKRFEHVYFENGTQIEHLPAKIKARHIHIPASVTSIDANMLTNDVTDIYMASSHLHNPDLNGDWNLMHTLHVPVGLQLAYQKSKWHVEYHFTIQEDNTLTVPVKERYILELQAEVFGQGTVIEAYANDYIDQIRNAATDATALTLRDQALAEIAILIKYENAVNEPYYAAPTEDGMRIRVKMNGGKVYEFNTRDVKSVNFINVQ